MGQSANFCKQQTDRLSESYCEQNNTDYFGPQYASNYLINTKFISHIEVQNSKTEEQPKGPQHVSSTNQTDQELPQNSIQKDEKFLTNSNKILCSLLDLDSNNLNSSYDNSINANKSILKKNGQKISKQLKSVKFMNIDSQIPFSITQQKQLGKLLKRKQK
ncbi:unnamed protein product [Paramecium pentaurelia]|uniref:Uncharacterized protein n=1 Tax=Paramecium pentaurelia TaxID=43138 RepID=A0A8S1U274_9CILI|nr:unnamed protein product [Paramecium pentaurelia]